MAKKLNSVLGIDIGSQSIKVAELKLQGRQPALTALAAVPTPNGAVDHIGIHDADAVAVKVKEACAVAGVSVADVVVSIAGQGSVLVRTLEVPAMSATELKQHMDWEVTRNIPFAESTVQSDYQAFEPEVANAQNLDVVMAIAPQSAIDMVLKLVKKSGKKTAAIDVEPLGLGRAYATAYPGGLKSDSVCVVDIGHKTTAINIYTKGKLMMPRQVPIGGEMFTRAIAEGLNVPSEEAERLKCEVAEIPEAAAFASPSANPFASTATQQVTPYNPFADPDEEVPVAEFGMPASVPNPTDYDTEGGRVYSAFAAVLDDFVGEVRRSVDYYRSKGGSVDRVYLCGGSSKLKGFAPFLTKALGMSVEVMDPLKGMNMQLKRPEAAPGSGKQEFAVAIGNCLHICF